MSDKEKGNGDLIYPIGLISADEINIAGGKYLSANGSYYLHTGYNYWGISPADFYNFAYVFYVYIYNYVYRNGVSNDFDVHPVINLNAEYCQQLRGNGSLNDPYREIGDDEVKVNRTDEDNNPLPPVPDPK